MGCLSVFLHHPVPLLVLCVGQARWITNNILGPVPSLVGVSAQIRRSLPTRARFQYLGCFFVSLRHPVPLLVLCVGQARWITNNILGTVPTLVGVSALIRRKHPTRRR